MFPQSHHTTLEKQFCGRWNIENNESPPNDIEQTITDEACIQKENMMSNNNSAEIDNTFSPKYQQEEIEKLLKLADDGCDDLDELDITAINHTDGTELVEEMEQAPSRNPSLRDHETVSDHDMNYEICNQKKAEQCVSKQILPHTAENVLVDNYTSVISKNKTNGKLTNHNDDNQSLIVNPKTATNGESQRPIPAPRNLFLKPETRFKIKIDTNSSSNSEVSVRERAKTFSFVETCQIPPTPFRYTTK